MFINLSIFEKHGFYSPNYEKVVPGEGMPLPDNPEKKGDLRIRFNIQFPKKLSGDQKLSIERAFFG
ncbi:uncharacterized protein DC041_0009238 [Schistosoma bovis]|uniref:Uncharacterized protein n=1 Tax=Schistosoma bovis TaxID=6184 RepID=A0A430QSM2_SCHBO|nr:uncharacterized protein DC041_0009238 [Schistosoma bovis]